MQCRYHLRNAAPLAASEPASSEKQCQNREGGRDEECERRVAGDGRDEGVGGIRAQFGIEHRDHADEQRRSPGKADLKEEPSRLCAEEPALCPLPQPLPWAHYRLVSQLRRALPWPFLGHEASRCFGVRLRTWPRRHRRAFSPAPLRTCEFMLMRRPPLGARLAKSEWNRPFRSKSSSGRYLRSNASSMASCAGSL